MICGYFKLIVFDHLFFLRLLLSQPLTPSYIRQMYRRLCGLFERRAVRSILAENTERKILTKIHTAKRRQ